MEPKREGKWYVANDRGDEIYGTRGNSKEEATGFLCEQLNMLDGTNYDWSYWKKRGYRLRKD